MPKLTETFVRNARHPDHGTRKHWDTEVRGFVLFVGKRSKTWYYQRDVAGRTQRKMIGRYPAIGAAAARETALAHALEMGRGTGKAAQRGAPRLGEAIEQYLARPKLRSQRYIEGVRANMQNHLRDWLGLPLDQIDRAMVAARHAELARHPSRANHVMREFRTVWNHARRTVDLPERATAAVL